MKITNDWLQSHELRRVKLNSSENFSASGKHKFRIETKKVNAQLVEITRLIWEDPNEQGLVFDLNVDKVVALGWKEFSVPKEEPKDEIEDDIDENDDTEEVE